MAEALSQLQQQQETLQQQLGELMQQLQEMTGMGNNSLEDAADSMAQATGELAQADALGALSHQGEALEALRDGAQSMARQILTSDPQGGRGGGNQDFADRDPLGRPQRAVGDDLGTTTKVPDEIDIQRARQILDEIRARLGEFARPPVERDYLERLIDDF
jgi:hypothetical protein